MAEPDPLSATEDALLGKLLIPGFISRREDGVYVILSKLADVRDFGTFVNRLFTGNLRFSRLDYALFLKLLYDADWLAEAKTKLEEVKLATGIVDFASDRQSLYRAVKLIDDGKHAEYMFEPVSIEVPYDEPVFGEPGEDGVAPIVEYVKKTRQIPANLDFDEFVADLWLKEVKFGIDEQAVRKVILSGETIRMQIAHYLPPTEGRDAEILEISKHLHRDDSPKILSNGRADLRMFKNHFPQMAKGERLIKKIPRQLGKQGRKVTGEVIEPEMPVDFDLFSLSSMGTNVEQAADGEYVVAIQDGFLVLDERSNKISVVEKIDSKEGISAKTTGDLELSVNEFIEHGEVQEGRVVKGNHMTFLADVYGSILSQGGNIRIEGNLTVGRAETHGGIITLNQLVSRATVIAHGGEVVAKECENSLISGKVVRLEHAVNCEIVAEEAYVNRMEACMVAARTIKILSADERRGRENLVTVLIPDYSVFDQYIAKLKKDIEEVRADIGERAQKLERAKSDPEFARYLLLDQKIKSGEIFLTDEQARNWQKLVSKHARAVNHVEELEAEVAELEHAIAEIEKEIAANQHEREVIGEGISCAIEQVAGQTVVQSMKTGNGLLVFERLTGGDVRAILQKMDSGKTRLFSNDVGAFDWKFKPAGGAP